MSDERRHTVLFVIIAGGAAVVLREMMIIILIFFWGGAVIIQEHHCTLIREIRREWLVEIYKLTAAALDYWLYWQLLVAELVHWTRSNHFTLKNLYVGYNNSDRTVSKDGKTTSPYKVKMWCWVVYSLVWWVFVPIDKHTVNWENMSLNQSLNLILC